LFSLLLVCEPRDEDRLIADLWEAGTSGIAEELSGLRAFFDDRDDVAALLEKFAAFGPVFRREDSIDWEQSSRDGFPPLLIGSRFFLVPPWRDDPAPAGRLRLEINPGMACGTGWHQCTQLCLEALERVMQVGAAVIDVGSGSGILSEAAMLLGAARVIACDIDAQAIAVARERVEAPMFVGSLDAVRTNVADVIVANISASVLEELASDLERVRGPESTLILSGFRDGEAPEGFTPREILSRAGWLCWIC
jgi:ribosomal protein L11 methyltransferase